MRFHVKDLLFRGPCCYTSLTMIGFDNRKTRSVPFKIRFPAFRSDRKPGLGLWESLDFEVEDYHLKSRNLGLSRKLKF